MAVNKDEVGKGKDDWMNYQNKLKEIKQNKIDDVENQKKKAEVLEKRKLARKPSPGQGGFQLG
jgi:hypothetical protein